MALTRRALGGLTLGGSAALTLAACGDDDGEGGSGRTELVWAVSSGWESWNENTSAGNNSYGHQAMTPMNAGSGDFDPDANFVYDDAIFSAAPELVSESPMQIKYTLKEDAVWSDGKPIRVEDFIFQWYSLSGDEAHANQEKALPATIDWGAQVASIEQADDGTITVTYKDGYIDPEWQFATTFYLPSHVAEENGYADWQTDPEVMGDAITFFNEDLWTVASGPYKPTEWSLGEYVIYEINDKYTGSIQPTVKKLTLKVIEGTEAIITELRQGSIDGSWPSEYSEEELAKIADDEALKSEVYEGSIWLHIDANLNNEFLADKALRQAIYTAVDTADIIAKSYPDTEVEPKGNYFFANSSSYYVDYVTDSGQGSGDVEAAKAILEEAGYTVGETLTTPDGKEVTLNFRYGETQVARKTAAELTQSYLEGLGIALELVAIPDGELGNVLAESDFDLIIFGWSGTPAFTNGPSQFFQTDSGSNFGHYSNADVDEAISKVRSTTDIDQAAEYANAVAELVVPDAYVLPLYDEPQSIVWNDTTVEGITANGNSQAGPLYNVREWKNK